MKNPQFKPLFDEIKNLVQEYEKYFQVQIDTEDRYELWSEKEVVIAGRKRKDIFFVGLIIQKSYVGFYYMPVYIEKELKKVFRSELLKLLKGKSCFYIKELNDTLREQIKEALEKGYKLYKERGWIIVH
jgi:hypothetical protein